MDSLQLYFTFQCKYFINENTADGSKFNAVDELINLICTEIFNPPVPLDKSPFLNEVIRSVERIDDAKKTWAGRVFLSDAYIVTLGLVAYMEDPRFITQNFFKEWENFLFNGKKIEDNDMRQIMKIKHQLMKLKEKSDIIRSKTTINKKYVSQIDKPQTNSSNNTNAIINAVKESGNHLPEKNEKRMEQNKVNVQLWYDEQAGISAKLMEMQPTVSQLLKDFMSFSDKITEQYVLQFARMQIELFNLIYDGYVYHKKEAGLSGNKDYVNAISNYNEYMLSIIDHLSVFGIEEIVSNSGTTFDGTIHESDTVSFSSKNALIAESVRSGFKYKNIVIQKEKIKICGGSCHETGN